MPLDTDDLALPPKAPRLDLEVSGAVEALTARIGELENRDRHHPRAHRDQEEVPRRRRFHLQELGAARPQLPREALRPR